MEATFNKVGGKLVTGIEFIDEHRYIPKALAIFNQVGNLRLTGETGTGKTYLTYALAQIKEMPLFEDVLTRDVSRWDLLGQDILESGSSAVRKGIVTQWLEAEKGILYLDGANYCEPSIFSLIESLADFRGNVFVPELNRVYERTPEHLLVISFNPAEKIGYSGTYQMNIATMRRFEGFTVEYLSPNKETDLIKEVAGNYNFARKWVEIANKTRSLYKKAKLRTPLTTGNLKNYAKLWKHEHMAEDEIIDIAKSLFPEEERDTVVRLWESSKTAQQMFNATQQTP
jgi:MoxR-like ATPase